MRTLLVLALLLCGLLPGAGRRQDRRAERQSARGACVGGVCR